MFSSYGVVKFIENVNVKVCIHGWTLRNIICEKNAFVLKTIAIIFSAECWIYAFFAPGWPGSHHVFYLLLCILGWYDGHRSHLQSQFDQASTVLRVHTVTKSSRRPHKVLPVIFSKQAGNPPVSQLAANSRSPRCCHSVDHFEAYHLCLYGHWGSHDANFTLVLSYNFHGNISQTSQQISSSFLPRTVKTRIIFRSSRGSNEENDNSIFTDVYLLVD